MQVPHIGQDKLSRITTRAPSITIESDHPIARVEEPSGPSAIAAKQVDAKRSFDGITASAA